MRIARCLKPVRAGGGCRDSASLHGYSALIGSAPAPVFYGMGTFWARSRVGAPLNARDAMPAEGQSLGPPGPSCVYRRACLHKPTSLFTQADGASRRGVTWLDWPCGQSPGRSPETSQRASVHETMEIRQTEFKLQGQLSLYPMALEERTRQQCYGQGSLPTGEEPLVALVR